MSLPNYIFLGFEFRENFLTVKGMKNIMLFGNRESILTPGRLEVVLLRKMNDHIMS